MVVVVAVVGVESDVVLDVVEPLFFTFFDGFFFCVVENSTVDVVADVVDGVRRTTTGEIPIIHALVVPQLLPLLVLLVVVVLVREENISM